MEIILREDVDKLGARGQVVKVTAGYARNFLLPKRLAVAATDSNKKIVEQERQAHLRKEVVLTGEAQDLAKLLASVTLSIVRKAGENGQLFGSVTAGDIADALEAQKFNIDRRKIQLDEPIRTLGEHKVTLRLHREVSTVIAVNVVPDAVAPEAAVPQA
jgi:large subunit ribosomal protein L9